MTTRPDRELEHVWIPMPDGIRLSARIWFPNEWLTAARSCPAILEYIPYRKRDMVRARDERNHPVFADNGYVSLRVDMRGSGDSEGTLVDMYSADEIEDAQHVISWIADQPWCNGKVGMMGTSWGGTSSLQAAWRHKDGYLKAILAVCATNDRYNDDIHHMGGCLLTDSLEWGASLPAILGLPGASKPEAEEWLEPWKSRMDNLAFSLQHWIAHETNDAYWKRGSVTHQDNDPCCPVLAIGGWSDRYSNTVMNLLADHPGSCWGVVGPWGHHYPDHGSPGPALDFQGFALAWWDHWLKDEPNDMFRKPGLRVWCGDYQAPAGGLTHRSGTWLELKSWPDESLSTQTISLCPSIEINVQEDEDSKDYLSIPNHLGVGRRAGDTGYFGRPNGLPLDQREDDLHSLCWESATLEQDCIILGKPELEVACKRDQKIATLVVRLCDVAPDGGVARISYLVRNLALDEDFEKEVPFNPDIPERVRLRFPNVAYRVARGHKLRLSFSTSYWPLVWTTPTRVNLKLQSRSVDLDLPTTAQAIDELTLHEDGTFARLLKPSPISLETTLERTHWYEEGSGTLGYQWKNPMSFVTHDKVGLEIGSETEAEYRVEEGNPTSARARFTHRLVLLQNGERITATGKVEVTASESNFFPKGSITLYWGEKPLCEKSWDPIIPRRFS